MLRACAADNRQPSFGIDLYQSSLTRDEARRIAANIAKLPEFCCAAVGHQKLPAAFSGPARGILRRISPPVVAPGENRREGGHPRRSGYAETVYLNREDLIADG